ncbi:MAG: glutamine synthetase [Hadesarchaea archaeon]|nr:glutamine synthetase [Hadesarchaea archaeon]
MGKVEEVIKTVEGQGVEFVQLQFMSIDGRVKSMTIHVSQFGEAIEEGWGFDGSSVPGYADIEESDLVLMPDLDTFRTLPWKYRGKRMARVLCDVCLPDGTPHGGDPRYVLENMLRSAERRGYKFFVGLEVEFYIFKGGKEPLDEGGYLDYAPYDKGEELRIGLASDLQRMGILVEKIHHEVSPGQYELDFRYSDALTTADHFVLCRQALKALGEEYRLHVDYSPKPLPGGMGNGLHCHHSLADSKGKNLFYDPSGEYRMSELARHFMAGELEHAPALTALAASVPDSYERLVPGYEAPVYVCWGGPNRSVLVRVPGYEVRRGSGMRFEYRAPDPLCNTHLLFAGLLAAGLDGIKRKLPLGPPVTENVYKMSEKRREELGISTLPKSLDEALDALESDDVIREALGPFMFEKYVALKREEAIRS